MIQVREIKEISAEIIADLTPFSKYEWTTAWAVRELLVEQSECIFTVNDKYDRALLVLGIVRPQLFRPPELWALLCNNLTSQPHQWRYMKRGFDDLKKYARLKVCMDCDNAASARFVRFFGFDIVKATEEELIFEVNKNAIH